MIFRYTFITVNSYMDSLKRSTNQHSDDFVNDITDDMKDDMLYFTSATVQTEKRFVGEQLAFGALIRDAEDYNYFADFIADNSLGGWSSIQ